MEIELKEELSEELMTVCTDYLVRGWGQENTWSICHIKEREKGSF